MAKTLPTVAECKRAATRINDLLPELFSYAQRKKLTVRPFRAYYDLAEVWKDYPEEWEDSVLGMLAGYAVCGQTKTCAAFVRSVRDRLEDREFALARDWRTVPWIWSVFEVVEDLGESRIAVRPVGQRPSSWPISVDWEVLYIYSPTIVRNFHAGVSLFLGQLMLSGDIFHTYGVILPFQSFGKTDLLAYADFVRLSLGSTHRIVEPLAGVSERTGTLSDDIAADPLPFLRLFEFTNAPQMKGRRGLWRRNASVVSFDGAGDISNVKYWEASLNHDSRRIHTSRFLDDAAAIYLEDGSPLYDPVVYLSFSTRRIFLVAANDDAYESGREALSPVVEMPQTPQVSCSMLVITAVTKILDVDDELKIMQDRFDSAELAPEAVKAEETVHPAAGDPDAPTLPTIDEVQKILDRLTYNHNEGIEETDADTARALGLDIEMVANLKRSFPSLGTGDSEHREVDRMGLSPRAFSELLSQPVPAAEGALVLRTSKRLHAFDSHFSEMIRATPIIRFTLWFLGKAGPRGKIAATAAGFVKPSMIREAEADGVIPTPLELAKRISLPGSEPSEESLARIAEILKPKREKDARDFHRYRNLLEASKIIRLSGNSFAVTNDGHNLLNDPIALYHRLIETMFGSHEWNESTRFQSIPGLRERAGFLFYALHTICHNRSTSASDEYRWEPISRLTTAYAGTIPDVADVLENPREVDSIGLDQIIEAQLHHPFISFFGESFGLVESRLERAEADTRVGSESESDMSALDMMVNEVWLVRPTPLFLSVFQVGKRPE